MSTMRVGTLLLRRGLDVVLLMLIAVVLFGVVLGHLVPMTGRTTLVIGGGSMEPAVPLGSAVVIEPVAAADLAVGDVVSLRSGPELAIFTHRITRLVDRPDGRWIETKGDANGSIDPSLTPTSAVLGRVVLTVPMAGYLIRLLSLPSGVILVICLAGVLLVMIWLLEGLEVERRRVARRVAPVAPSPTATAAAASTTPPPAPSATPAMATTPATFAAKPRTIARHFADARAMRARRARWLANRGERQG